MEQKKSTTLKLAQLTIIGCDMTKYDEYRFSMIFMCSRARTKVDLKILEVPQLLPRFCLLQLTSSKDLT